jgi:hypothetical protein
VITKSTTPLSEHDWHSKALAAVITVGDGRGFVVADGHNNLIVVTGAHCLPDLPPATPASYPEDRFYPNLLAPLGGTPSVACECLFADPVGDIALLGPPDVMSGELDAYYALIDDELVTPLRIEPPGDEGVAVVA